MHSIRLTVLLTLLGWQFARAQTYQPSLDIRIPYSPEWFTIEGRSAIFYELHITNFAADTFRLLKLHVLNAADSSPVAVIKPNKNVFPPGATTVIYIELSVQNPSPGLLLLHLLTGDEQEVCGALTGPIQQAQLVLGPPLQNGPWVAIYDPRWERGHRQVIYTVDGKARIPGRYAIDFIKVNQQGRYAKNNEDSIQNWYGYGSPVLAVADGNIAAVRNDFTESPSVSKHQQPDAAQATGNYIALDLGNGRFAYYEHLQPGSIQVKPGQKVKKGQSIAALGFTGQTTGPHLHFHVADQLSPLGAEGIPFVFEQFTVLGYYTDLEKFGSSVWTPLNNTGTPQKKKERPIPNAVIRFQP